MVAVAERYASSVGRGVGQENVILAVGMAAQHDKFGSALIRLRAECDGVSKTALLRGSKPYSSHLRGWIRYEKKKLAVLSDVVEIDKAKRNIEAWEKEADRQELEITNGRRSERQLLGMRMTAWREVLAYMTAWTERISVHRGVRLNPNQVENIALVAMSRWVWDQCPHCSGTGVTAKGGVETTCKHCGGSGKTSHGDVHAPGLSSDQIKVLRALLCKADESAGKIEKLSAIKSSSKV